MYFITCSCNYLWINILLGSVSVFLLGECVSAMSSIHFSFKGYLTDGLLSLSFHLLSHIWVVCMGDCGISLVDPYIKATEIHKGSFWGLLVTILIVMNILPGLFPFWDTLRWELHFFRWRTAVSFGFGVWTLCACSHRYVYWADWGDHAYIARIGMDGTNKTVIISTKIEWPNAITIDYTNDLLYWADAHLGYIE